MQRLFPPSISTSAISARNLNSNKQRILNEKMFQKYRNLYSKLPKGSLQNKPKNTYYSKYIETDSPQVCLFYQRSCYMRWVF